jgi:cytochrome b6-f complex iron-sulfur subunit
MDAGRSVGRRGFLAAMGQAVVLLLLAGCTGSSRKGTISLTRNARSIVEDITRRRSPMYIESAQAYVSLYPPERIDQAVSVYDSRLLPGMRAGLVALHQRCTHLGCRVPFCTTSQWFECPCHRSMYNLAGEQRGGPAPRGLDHHPIVIAANGSVSIDTSTIVRGAPLGTDTTGQVPAGPHCVGPSGADRTSAPL